MNNKLNANFSMRKLLLTALVAGPLATLPAPLWALPSIDVANLNKSAGVDVQQVGTTTLNITSPDKGILTWVAFGSGTSGINVGDTLNFSLPANGSVLNNVTGNVATKIEGSISSNGNVYVLNPAGIIIGQNAQISTGGFYASTIAEPAGYFSINGSLSLSGTATKNIVVQGTGTTTGTAASIQAIGTGNNIFLAGAGVNVQGGRFFGNLTVRATQSAADLTDTLGGAIAADALVSGRNVAFGSTGPVSINLVGSPLSGGGLNIASNGGNVSLTTGATVANSVTIAPNVASTTGAVVVNTTSASGNGNIIQGSAPFTASTTGTVVTLNAGTGTTNGNITLDNVDFATVGATGNNVTVIDTSGNLVISSTNSVGTLKINTPGDLTQATGAVHTAGGTIDLKTGTDKTLNFTSSGNVTFGTIGTASTMAITSSGDIKFTNAVATGRNMTVVSTGGQITATSITSGSTLTLTATSAQGKLTATSIRSSNSGGTVNISGDIVGTTPSGIDISNAGGTLGVTSTAGSITAAGVSSTSTLNVTATTGNITTGTVATATLNVTAGGNIAFAGGSNHTLSNATSIVAAGNVNVSNGIVSSGGNLAITSTGGSITTSTLSSNTGVTLTTSSTAGAITTGAINIATTRQFTIASGGDVSLNTVTAPVMVVNSTSGSITQSGAITSTSSATFNALNSIVLTNSGNDFKNVVLVGGINGVQVTDNNDIVLAGGTAVTGNATITAGAGIQSYTSVPTVTVPDPAVVPVPGAVTRVGGSVTAIAVGNGGGGYLTAPTVTITGGGGTGATAVAAINTTTGVITGYTITNAGTGYTSAPTIGVTAPPTGTQGTATVTLSGGTTGVITAINYTAGTARYATTPVLTLSGPASGAIITANLTDGLLPNGSVSVSQSGSIALGSQAIDSLVFGGSLTLSTSGIAATNSQTLTPYSVITTPANSVRVFGNVSLNTNGTNASLGNTNVFGNAANYSYGQISANLGAGQLTVVETQTANLGNITAASLDARSTGGNIVNTGRVAISGTATFSAGTIFSPTDVSLTNASNSMPTVVIANARDFTLVNTVGTTVTAGSALVAGKAATGTVNVTVSGGAPLTMNAANGGDYNIVGFTSTGAVTITDPNSITIQNATTSGTATTNVTAAGVITLGSGINLGANNGTVNVANFISTGTSAGIVDSAPNIRIFGASSFKSDNSISITNSGHSLGAVSLETTGSNGSAGTANITYTEGGTAILNVVSVNSSGNTAVPAGSLTVVSTGGGIGQTATTGSIMVPQPTGATNTVTLTGTNGGVVLSNPAGTNSITPVITISATGNSSVTQSGNVTLGNIAVTAGTFDVDNSGSASKFISQTAGTTIKSFGNASFKTQAGKITLANSGNNFGGLTLQTNDVGGLIAVSNAGTSTLTAGVITATTVGTAGNGFAANATGGTALPVVITGGGGTGAVVTANTNAQGVVTSYNIVSGGTGYTSAPTLSIVSPVLAGADVAVMETGTLNLANVNTGTAGKFSATSEQASIIQSGNITVGGNTTLTASAAGINLSTGATNNNFGGASILITTVGNVSIQDSNLTTVLAGGSNVGGSLTVRNTNGVGEIKDSPGILTVSGNVLFDTGTNTASKVNIGSSTASLGAIQFRSGAVTIVENATLNLAAGSIASGPVSLTSASNIVTSGAGGGSFQSRLELYATGSITITNPIFVNSGLTFRALGAVDLSALSLAGNLNSIAPINLGASSYKAPSP